MKRLYLCFLILFLAVSYAFGSEKNYALEDIVVTEAKIEQSEINVTQKVDIMTKEEIDKISLKNNNLSELITFQPGVFINPLSRNDANWGSFGGLGPKYNLFLLDGVPIDNMVDPMSLSAVGVDRVEIFRGPASIQYSNYLTADFAGSQSPLAGVTNFIMKEKIEKDFSKITLGTGSWNTNFTNIYHQNRKGNLNYFFGADYERSNYSNYGTYNSWLKMIDDPQYQKNKIYGKLTYFFKPDKHSFSIFANHTQHTGDAGRPNRDFNHNYDTVNFDYKKDMGENANIILKAGYRNYHRRWAEDFYDYDGDVYNDPNELQLREHGGVRQKIIPVDFQYSLKHFGNSIFIAGVDYQKVYYDTYTESNGLISIGNNSKTSSYGLYLQEKLVLNKLTLRLGGRLNKIESDYELISGVVPPLKEKDWNKILLSGGLRYSATNNISVFANAGMSFTPPSAKQVGGTIPSGSPNSGQLPNPNLKPESGYSYDVGLEAFFDKFYMSLRGFYTIVDDAIVENVVSLSPSQSRSENAGKSKSVGLELEIKNQFTNNFAWFGNLTLINTKVNNPFNINFDNSDITFVPDYTANLGFNAKLPFEISFSPYATFVGKYYDSTDKSSRREFGSYEYVNINISKELTRNKDYSVDLAFDINNLFNRKYEMPWQFQDPGFNVKGALSVKF
ncbi:MAG: TonB-dependent receptor [Proteobacteria bacterium]|nr:TonB-dependent receptor [Pseudomonadota bacterium]